MSDYQGRESFIIEQAFDANSATQKHPLGMIVRAEDTASTAYGFGEFIYLKGLASTAVGEWVLYQSDNWATKLAVADDFGPLAVAMSACVASEFGWYQIHGKAVGLAGSGFNDDADVYLTATPGTVDDTNVGGDYVRGARGASAVGTPSSGLAEFEIARPSVSDLKDD